MGVGGHEEGAAGTDATSGSLQKAGLQQGWMLTALSVALSRDSLRGRFLRTLSKAAFMTFLQVTLLRTLCVWGFFPGALSRTTL